MKIFKGFLKTLMVAGALSIIFAHADGQTLITQTKFSDSFTGADNVFREQKSIPVNVSNVTVAFDTLRCLYNQLSNSHQPAMTWRKGYIVLLNKKLIINNADYPVAYAPQLTGLIQNQFLKKNKTSLVSQKVIQVILLQ